MSLFYFAKKVIIVDVEDTRRAVLGVVRHSAHACDLGVCEKFAGRRARSTLLDVVQFVAARAPFAILTSFP